MRQQEHCRNSAPCRIRCNYNQPTKTRDNFNEGRIITGGTLCGVSFAYAQGSNCKQGNMREKVPRRAIQICLAEHAYIMRGIAGRGSFSCSTYRGMNNPRTASWHVLSIHSGVCLYFSMHVLAESAPPPVTCTYSRVSVLQHHVESQPQSMQPATT